MPRDCSLHIPVLYLHSIALSPFNLVSAAFIPAPRNNLHAERREETLGRRANAMFSSQVCQTSEKHLGIITFPKGALSPMALTAGVARNTGQGRIAGRTQTDFVPGSPANALQVVFLLGETPSS
ncbi:hypothetical protein COCVIDRAFT_34788 [Bipolaris victoriae FI3]|uniref:Uncharacterized protein n=1 Tax=Bipolaris victoriae (strain FI3) TaxID=930091 RepID=W7EWY9_BIPV3|nr:hypothetical protein COCVIDRAFT_34788 [Bipolaris victoriae FI3]